MLAPLVVVLAAVAVPALGAITPPGPSSYTYVFAGCAYPPVVHSYNNYAKVYGLTQAECDVYVTTVSNYQNYMYSFWVPGQAAGAQSECFLGNTPPTSGGLQAPNAGDPDGSCPPNLVRAGVLKDRAAGGTAYEYRYAGCYAGMRQIDPPAYAGNFFNGGTKWAKGMGYRDFSDCFMGCTAEFAALKASDPDMYASSPFAYALWYPWQVPEMLANNYRSCICAIGPVEGDPVRCEDYNGGPKFTMSYLYPVQINDDEPLPSTLPNRRRAAKLKQKAMIDAKLHAYCPEGLTACRVALNSDNAYECIDTSSELESCGGCLYGEYGLAAGTRREVMGKDCTNILGVVAEAAQCRHGQCVTTACRPGYKLVYDHCVQA